MAPILEATDIRKTYGTTEALRGLSLAVEEGEMFGLLGPNGAGKTTLLSILSCLIEPTAGKARLFGKELDRNNLAIRPLIGLATQDLALYSDLTARENLAFFGKLYGLRNPQLTARVEEILEFTALKERADDRVVTFSGGMKRRLNLGVAVVHRPKLLFLDEPTTGVDPQSRHHLFEEVKSLNAMGTTVVYTSHYMEEVQSLCPKIAIIDHGRVIACDTRENLLHLLPGSVEVRLNGSGNRLANLMGQWKQVSKVTLKDDLLTLASSDVRSTTLHLIMLLREFDIEMLDLKTSEPNLEQVFLHLTNSAVRDT